MAYNFFDKKASTLRVNKFVGSGIKNENISYWELAEKLQKRIIKKFEKRKVH